MTGKTFTGTPGLDSIIGTDGDDTIRPGDGPDFIHGKGGNDTLVLDHPIREYKLQQAAPGVMQFGLLHRPSGDTKSLNSIERFKFSDTPVLDWRDEWGILAVQSATPAPGKVDVSAVLAALDGAWLQNDNARNRIETARAAIAKLGGV